VTQHTAVHNIGLRSDEHETDVDAIGDITDITRMMVTAKRVEFQ